MWWWTGEYHLYNKKISMRVMATTQIQQPVWRVFKILPYGFYFLKRFSKTCGLTRMQLLHYSRTNCTDFWQSSKKERIYLNSKITIQAEPVIELLKLEKAYNPQPTHFVFPSWL